MRVAIVRLPATPLVMHESQGVFGGAEVRALTFARGLADRTENDVRLVVRSAEESGRVRATSPHGRLAIHLIDSPGSRRSPRNSLRRIFAWPSGSIRRIARSVQRRVGRHPALWPEISRLPVEVVGSFGLHDPTASIVRSARAAGKVAIVFLTSDDDTDRAMAPTAMIDRHRRWHRYAIENANLIVAQTQQQFDRIQTAGCSVVLIRNPIDTTLVDGQLLPMGGRKHVLWVGRADVDCKRADLCWQVASRCPDVPFVAVMNPQDRVVTDRLVREAPPNVQIRPHVDWQCSDELYRDAMALLNTSESEGFPNAFLQAAKFGVPILSRRVNPDQVLTRFQIGFVAHDDLNQLAQMVRQIHQAPQQFTRVSDASRRYVERYHALGARIDELNTALGRFARHADQPRAA